MKVVWLRRGCPLGGSGDCEGAQLSSVPAVGFDGGKAHFPRQDGVVVGKQLFVVHQCTLCQKLFMPLSPERFRVRRCAP